MTATPTFPKLTGADLYEQLIRARRINPNIELAEFVILCGYWDGETLSEAPAAAEEFNDAMQAGIEAYATKYGLTKEQYHEATEEFATFDNSFQTGYTAYQYIRRQWWLDQEGNEDQKITDQQSVLLAEVDLKFRKARAAEGRAVGGELGSDLAGVIANLWSNTMWRFKYGSKEIDAMGEEKAEQVWRELYDYAMNTEVLKRITEVANIDHTEAEMEEYMQFRWHQHKRVGAVLATHCIDYSYDTDYANSDAFKGDLPTAKAFLSMFNENCKFTTVGITGAVLCSVLDDHNVVRNGKHTHKEVHEHFDELLRDLVADGNAIRAEYAVNK